MAHKRRAGAHRSAWLMGARFRMSKFIFLRMDLRTICRTADVAKRGTRTGNLSTTSCRARRAVVGGGARRRCNMPHGSDAPAPAATATQRGSLAPWRQWRGHGRRAAVLSLPPCCRSRVPAAPEPWWRRGSMQHVSRRDRSAVRSRPPSSPQANARHEPRAPQVLHQRVHVVTLVPSKADVVALRQA